MNNKYDWKKIQEFYDEGNSGRDIIKHFKIGGWSVLRKACNRGDLIMRNVKDALLLERARHPEKHKHSEETKKKISQIRKKYLQENPDKVPYKLNHYSKGDSYPEKYFKELFEKENIPLKFHLQVGLYELDFYNDEYNICVEIDGEQHYKDKRIVESDIRRTNFLAKLGWRVYRIRWAEYQKLSYEDKTKVIDEVRQLCIRA